ncbi:helix-turn-helix transcriptional regulator (plasmid) [Rhizobium sp. WL3]|nr:helix-turn-helix transcriptional regulator [Rhizobium sp. WL3]
MSNQMGIFMSAVSLQIDNSHHRGAQVVSQHHQVSRLLAHAMSLVERDQDTAIEFVRRASALAGDMVAPDENRRTSVRGGLAPWQVERVKRYIEKAYSDRINIDELAHMTRLSSSYFSAAFRVSFGTSPHAYVCRRRVDQAKHLMVTTERPLCEIALDCGFSDQPHLSRVFRRLVGATPAAWRRLKRPA